MFGTLVDFKKSLTLPEFGHLILVRDGNLYHRPQKATRSFFPLFEANCEGLKPESILPTDIVYNFPEKNTIFKALKNGACLDGYIVDSQVSQRQKMEKIKQLLDSGRFIGVENTGTKYHISYKDNGFVWSTLQREGFNYTNFGSLCVFYEFNNIYEVGAWMAQK